MTIRKFFDPQVAEPSTSQSVAELMAANGVKSEGGEYKSTPIDITEKKEENSSVPEPTPAETAIVETKPDNGTPEPPQPKKEEPPVEIPQKAEPPAVVPTWQEVLKSQQPDTVFKEMGLDDNMVKLVNRIKDYDPKVIGLIQAYEKGTHVDYLRELTTDYSKLSAEEVMRHQLKQEYPKASDKALDALYMTEVIEKYKLDSTDDDEVERGRLLLDAKADRYRDEFVKKQEAYLVPKAPEPKSEQPDNKVDEGVKQFEVYKSQFLDSPITKDIFTNKKFSIGEGENKFTADVDPQAIQEILYNGQKWLESTSIVTNNADGTMNFVPDVKKQFLIGMVAKYGEDFLNDYAKHYKSLGGKTVVDDIENAKPPEENPSSSPSQKAPSTVAEAMARQGSMNYGGRG